VDVVVDSEFDFGRLLIEVEVWKVVENKNRLLAPVGYTSAHVTET